MKRLKLSLCAMVLAAVVSVSFIERPVASNIVPIVEDLDPNGLVYGWKSYFVAYAYDSQGNIVAIYETFCESGVEGGCEQP